VNGETAPFENEQAAINAPRTALAQVDCHGAFLERLRMERPIRPEPDDRRDPEKTVTPRQLECLRLLVQGANEAEIAAALAITVHTVRFHLDRARRTFAARSRTHLAALAVSAGIARP
jgi:DNA-binding CsgD family transcriptional regulator